ncbi:hypothetical protein GDO86_018336, partial [Hymenochirus boettgeri]
MGKALAKYTQELTEWEEKEKCQSAEFTFSDAMGQIFAPKNCLALSGSVEVKSNQCLPEIQRYKTLPPIRNAEIIRPPASRDRKSRMAENEAQKVWTRPEPPVPLQLHLAATGRSHHINDFLSQFDRDFQRHFQQRLPKEMVQTLSAVEPQQETGESEKFPIELSPEEQEMVADITASIIRSLLDDQHFHEELKQIQEDQLPYFSQLRTQNKLPEKGNMLGTVDLAPNKTKPQIPPANLGKEEQDKRTNSVSTGGISQNEPQSKLQLNQELGDHIKRTPLFSHLVESVLENTLLNIL